MAVKKSTGKSKPAASTKSKKSGKKSGGMTFLKIALAAVLIIFVGVALCSFSCMDRKGLIGTDKDIEGRVVEVYDGDTIDIVTKDNEKYRIRFFGIDAPEKIQPYGIESRDVLREKILGKTVKAVVVDTDSYGRRVAKIMLGDRYINLEMVREGAAWHYVAYAENENDLANAEKSAREQNLGIWRDPYPVKPWEWRRANSNK